MYSPALSPTASGLIITSLRTIGPPLRKTNGAPTWQSTTRKGVEHSVPVPPEFMGVPSTGPLVQFVASVPGCVGSTRSIVALVVLSPAYQASTESRSVLVLSRSSSTSPVLPSAPV